MTRIEQAEVKNPVYMNCKIAFYDQRTWIVLETLEVVLFTGYVCNWTIFQHYFGESVLYVCSGSATSHPRQLDTQCKTIDFLGPKLNEMAMGRGRDDSLSASLPG
jgi:hypothetical protein